MLSTSKLVGPLATHTTLMINMRGECLAVRVCHESLHPMDQLLDCSRKDADMNTTAGQTFAGSGTAHHAQVTHEGMRGVLQETRRLQG